MTLAAGMRVGVYAILEPLGSGGMGEVYRARDTRLGREVAVKALPEEFSRDPGRLARFEREARMLAALNHPAIAAIYGLEEADGTCFIVMELVGGETLSGRLSRGALPVEEALHIGRQIAEALEAAHERGIVHRDLKPANIKVTPEGRVKVLDFGLAKALDTKESGSDADASLTPTLVLEGTQPGVILGTAEFMSPEQARGKPVDKRTDIWAFGCILYELLSGRRAFTGETASDVLAAILTSEPRWDVFPPDVPPRVRELLGRCLQKDPGRRVRDAGDARIEIDETLAEREASRPRSGSVAPAPSGAAPAVEAAPRRFRPRAAVTAAAVAVLALGLVAAWLAVRPNAAWLAVRPKAESRLPDRKYLAVLPFRDLSGKPGSQAIGDGLVETVSVRLFEVPGIQVVTPTAVVRAAHDAGAEEMGIYRAARKLGANLLLRCTYQRQGERVRFTYAVLDADDSAQLAAGSADGNASEFFEIQDRLAEKVVASLRLPSAPRREPGALPAGLSTADELDRYLEAVGRLQRYDKADSVDEAIRLLRALAIEQPSSALLHASLGRAYLYKFTLTREQSWVDLAVGSVSRAQQLDATLPEVDITLGELRIRSGQPKDAVEAFERAIRRRPNDLEARAGLARAYDLAGERAGAEETYRHLIALQPEYWASYSQLGAFYNKHGRYDRAAEMFRRVTELTPDSERAFANLGAVLFKLGTFGEARRAYESSIRIKPSAGAYTNLGTLEFFLGNFGEAAEAFEQAVELIPANYLHWANLGDAYRWAASGKPRSTVAYERAITLARREIELNPRNDAAHRTLAMCLARTGKPAEARAHIRQALGTDSENPSTLYAAAIVATLEGRRDEAVEWIDKACAAGLTVRQVEAEPEFKGLRELAKYRNLLTKRRA